MAKGHALWFLLALLAAAQASARQGTITRSEVVRLAMDHNPTLAAALLEVRRVAQVVAAEEDLYPFVLTADAQGGRSTTPSLGLDGVTLSTGESFALTAGMSKAFATGTRLSLEVGGTVDHQDVGGGLGPSYGLTGKLTLTQPFLRGFGTDVGEATWRQARLSLTASEHRAHQVASEVLLGVLTAWWEFWYATTALTIHREARDLAARELDEVQGRIAKGALASVEALAFQTTLAAREEEVAQAQDLLTRQGLELWRLVGRPEEPGEVASEGERPEAQARVPQAREVAGLAVEASFQIRELEVQVDLARDRALVAGEELRPRLDLQAWVQGDGLGNESVVPALEQIGQAGGAFVGLSFEMPLSSARRRALREEAALAVGVAERNLLAVAHQVRTEAALWVSRRRAADQSLELSLRTAELAFQQVEAERRRYEAGAAIALQVQQAEDSLRQARLRVARAQVDRVLADVEMEHLTGRLLGRIMGGRLR